MYNRLLFRGTDRLKFTANEQDLIRSAEQAQGYRRDHPSGSDFARLLVRILVWALSSMFMAVFIVAGIGSSHGTLSRALGVLIQGPAAEVNASPSVKDGRAPTIPERQGMDHQPAGNAGTGQAAPTASPPEGEVVAGTLGDQASESEATALESSPRGQTPEQVEGERRIEFATMDEAVVSIKERGHMDEFVMRFQQQVWTGVEAEKETLLLEGPRFDAPILGRLAPGVRYSVIDTQLQCSQLADLTWKVARIRVTSSQSNEGLVCTPKQVPQIPNSGLVSFTGPNGSVVFMNSR